MLMNMLISLMPEKDFMTSIDYVDDGLLDSIDILLLVSEIEREFNILIDPLDIIPENFNTLEAIEKLINKTQTMQINIGNNI